MGKYASYGEGVRGSDSLLTSTANIEVVPNAPVEWSDDRFTFYKFYFMNRENCTVVINGDSDNPIYLDAFQGFQTDGADKEIESFVIREANIRYNFVGWY